jgi:hypothetical protein
MRLIGPRSAIVQLNAPMAAIVQEDAGEIAIFLKRGFNDAIIFLNSVY